MWAAIELPYTALKSSFMVDGFMRNRLESSSMVILLERSSVSRSCTRRMVSICSRGVAAVVLPGFFVRVQGTGRRCFRRILLRAGYLHGALYHNVQQPRLLRIRRPIAYLLALSAADYQAAGLELLQVVGYGGAGHIHKRRYVQHALLAVA